jgi:hypothetical protein
MGEYKDQKWRGFYLERRDSILECNEIILHTFLRMVYNRNENI